MLLKIRNFGPIQSCDIDLSKNFTLIVGQNNIGKSYAISLVYVLLKVLSRRPDPRIYAAYYHREYRDDKLVGWLDSVAQEVVTSANGEDTDITKDVATYFVNTLGTTLLLDLQDAFEGTFNDLLNLQNRLNKDALEFSIHLSRFSIKFGIIDGKLAIKDIDFGPHQFVLRIIKTNRTVKHAGRQTFVYASNASPELFRANFLSLLSELADQFYADGSTTAANLHYLPASRSGLYQALSAFGQIIAELSKSRSYLTRKIELPAISETVSDYFLKLSDIRINPQAKLNRTYVEIAEKIENEILKGKVEFETKTKRLLYKPDKIDLTLDLSATSSMVSEISPIVTYLKYVLPNTELALARSARWRTEPTSRQVLIIEEPEAHLHPEVQILLMDAFCRLVSETRTRIIMTSHSNYIFNKVNNLVISGKVPHETLQAILFQSTSKGSEAVNLPAGRYGVDDENFADVSEKLYEERVELLKSKQA
ncbi:AAA family ATPase [Burkholderia ubonensis]|uniref:AAA family ATPase n=1 Tax=Burkholderia ubonensis TaxID=101571 RepID=UPI0009B345FA|nr:AAA family ATPase [Burkholderia ubonensis]